MSPTGRGLATRTATAHSGLSHSTRHGVGGRHLHKLQGTHTVLEQFGEQFGMILGRFNMYLPRTHTARALEWLERHYSIAINWKQPSAINSTR